MKKIAGKISWPILGVGLVIAVLALGFGFRVGLKHDQNKGTVTNLATATVLPNPRAIVPFKLTDNKNQVFDNNSLKGHWTFLFFGFTNCPHICPTTMDDMRQVFSIFQKDKIKEPNFVMVSIDPERDTVKKVNTFVTAFNPDFEGAIGSKTEIEKLTKAMGIVYMKTKPKSDPEAVNFEIDHSGTIVLVNPQGKITAFFSMPHEPKKIAKDFEKIQSHFG